MFAGTEIKKYKMKINLTQGIYSSKESTTIITKMIDLIIKYEEDQIKKSMSEEDAFLRNERIKLLLRDLYESRDFIERQKGNISINCQMDLLQEN